MKKDYPRHNVKMNQDGTGLVDVCTFDTFNPSKNDWSKCPHFRETRDHSALIKDNILDCVGNTPMVRINNITKKDGIKCEILAKCEFLNPSGSLKDRIARRMVVSAMKEGKIKEGSTILEPTSGNTGLALSMAAAVHNMNVVVALKEMMSQEKTDVMAAMGTEFMRIPNHIPYDHIDGLAGNLYKLEKELGNSIVFNQYINPANPMAHYEETGQEIWEQCSGKLDYVFIGAGTCGTMTGIARALKEKDPNIKVIAIDAYGSLISEPPELNVPNDEGGNQIEGIGKDFKPLCRDVTVIDEFVKISNRDAFDAARRIIKEEGMLVGSTAGANLVACLDYIKKHNIGEGKRCVIICADNIRNHITKFVNNDWLTERGYMTEQECMERNIPRLIPYKQWGQDFKISDLPLQEALFLDSTTTVKQAIDLMRQKSFDQFPVRCVETGKTLGMVRTNDMTAKLAKRIITINAVVT